MGMNFPSSPAPGQVYGEPGGYTYVFLGGVWRMVQVGQSVVTADTRNRIVNPAMQISQENGFTSITTAHAKYVADQWPVYAVGMGISAVCNNTTLSPNGSNRIAANLGLKASLAATDFMQFQQAIEGINIADFLWGAAQAKPLVLRFTTQAHVAGTYCVCIRNGALDRSWIGAFNIPVAAVDTTITMVIPGDTTGTWTRDNSVGLYISFQYAVGTTFQGVAGWQAGDKRGIAGMTNAASVAGGIGLMDVGLYLDPGNTGVPPPWQMPDEADELRACERYYEVVTCSNTGIFSGNVTANVYYLAIPYRTEKRITPAVTAAGGSQSSAFPAGPGTMVASPWGSREQRSATITSNGAYFYSSTITSNARL